MHRLTGSIIIMLLLALASCAQPRPVALDPLGEPPEDFTIDLTILSEPQRRQERPTESHLRPSRIVLFADGSLHYDVDDQQQTKPNHLPGLTRRLTRSQVAQVWALTRQLGFANPEIGEPPVNFNLIESRQGEVAYLLSMTGNDERWMFIRSAPLAEEQDPAMVELVRTLAHLSWGSDLPEREHTIGFRRYDFGPDPYARYRR